MIAEPPAQIEHNGQAGEIARRILHGAVGRVDFRYILLRQLDVLVHHQRIGHVPYEHQVLGRMRHCENGYKIEVDQVRADRWSFGMEPKHNGSVHVRLSTNIEHTCVSCGYDSNFMAHDSTSVNLNRLIRIGNN